MKHLYRIVSILVILATMSLAGPGQLASAYLVPTLDQAYEEPKTHNCPTDIWTCIQTFTAGRSGPLMQVDLSGWSLERVSVTVEILAVDQFTVIWSVTDPESGIATSTGCQEQTIQSTDLDGTTITCNATNGDGDTASNQVTLKVDQTPPSVTLSQLFRQPDRNGWYNAPVRSTFGIIQDNESGGVADCPTLTPNSDPYTGPDGEDVTLTYSCTNQAGLTGSQTLTFNFDNTDPTISIDDITEEATGPGGASITFAPATFDAMSGVDTTTCQVGVTTVQSGDTFPVGDTMVTCTVMDIAGNTASDTFTITVEDTTDPMLTVPENMSIQAVNATSVVVSFVATATDIVDGSFTPLCTPPSGSSFSFGTTTVTCTATDTAGNSTEGQFTITVGIDSDYEIVAVALVSSGGTRSIHRVVTREDRLSMSQAKEVCRAAGFDTALGTQRYRQGGVRYTDVTCADNSPSTGRSSSQ